MKINIRKPAIGLAFLVFLLVLVKLAMMAYAGITAGPAIPRFAERSEAPTVVLKDGQFGEQVRLVQYAADKRTRVSMRIERYDGGSATVEFGTNGKAAKLTEYYPVPTPAAPAPGADSTQQSGADSTKESGEVVDPLKDTLVTRTIMRETLFKSDGSSVASQTAYRTDGSLKEVAVRTAEDNLLVTVYREDKNGVERIQVFDKTTGLLKNERVFNADGTVASLLTEDKSNYYSKATQDFFGSDGKRTRNVLFTNWDVTVTDYAADGVTLKQSIQYSSGDIIVIAYDTTSGKKQLERRYNPTSKAIQVTYYDAAGTSVLVQRWVVLDPTIPVDRVGAVNDGYVLSEVADMHSDGLASKRIIRYYPGGKVVGQVEIRPTMAWTNRTMKTYRPDGSLDKVEEYYWSQVTKTVTSPPGPNSDREVVPADWTKPTKLFPAPAFDKSDAPKLMQRPLSYSFD
jgi:hypothetical protein